MIKSTKVPKAWSDNAQDAVAVSLVLFVTLAIYLLAAYLFMGI